MRVHYHGKITQYLLYRKAGPEFFGVRFRGKLVMLFKNFGKITRIFKANFVPDFRDIKIVLFD